MKRSTELPRRVSHTDIVLTVGDKNCFSYQIRAENGIHARPAGALVRLAEGLDGKVTFCVNGKSAPADSIIGILSLGAVKGSILKVSAEGADASVLLQKYQAYLEENL